MRDRIRDDVLEARGDSVYRLYELHGRVTLNDSRQIFIAIIAHEVLAQGIVGRLCLRFRGLYDQRRR